MFNTLELSVFSKTLGSRLVNITNLQQFEFHKELEQVIAFLDYNLSKGNSCLPLYVIEKELGVINLKQKLMSSPSLVANDENERLTPLLYKNSKLSFRDSYKADKEIENYIRAKQNEQLPISVNLDRVILTKLDIWQKIAVITSTISNFSIISGGAGTGKTTVLSKILELVLLDNPKSKIILAAPTGKAANRLLESIGNYIEAEITNPELKINLKKLEVKTLHQVLAISQTTGQAYNNDNNPLNCDFIAIDECSMVANNIFLQVINALPKSSKVILLGDENQLGAINSPAFFNNVAKTGDYFSSKVIDYLAKDNNLGSLKFDKQKHTVITKLKKSFRFNSKSSISNYANLVLKKDYKNLIAELEENGDISSIENCLQEIGEKIPREKNKLLAFLDDFIVLCAKRRGRFSSEQVNSVLDRIVRKVILKDKKEQSDNWYLGKRIIIERNYYSLGVFNGDIGKCIFVTNKVGRKELVVDFGYKILKLFEIPEKHSLAYAISIHKSQGSEYQNIEVILNSSKENFLDNALIYTAITRAKQSLSIYCDKMVLEHSVVKMDEKFSNIELEG